MVALTGREGRQIHVTKQVAKIDRLSWLCSDASDCMQQCDRESEQLGVVQRCSMAEPYVDPQGTVSREPSSRSGSCAMAISGVVINIRISVAS